MNRLIAFAALALIASCPRHAISAANTEAGGYEVIANAFGFGADIEGCADASKNIREISIDELNIDIRDLGGESDGSRLYGPGAAHWGSARFSSACRAGGSKELKSWFDECAKGKNIRKNITVTLFKSDKTPGRSYVLFDCFPTQWSVSDQEQEPWETITVTPGRIEFVSSSETSPPSISASATTSDKFAQVRGFKVDIANAGGKEVDTAWESVSGGLDVLEMTQTSIGADKFRTNSPGHKSVGEITLRGAMTDQRSALCSWINETVSGKSSSRVLSTTEMVSVTGSPSLAEGKKYEYKDCFPVRYVFPRMSVTNTTGNVMESIRVHAVREDELPEGLTAVLEIEGCPESSKASLAVAIDPRALDLSLAVGGADARDMSATILLPEGAGNELLDWYHEHAAAKAARKAKKAAKKAAKKSMSARILKDGRPTGQTITLHDCVPASFSALSPPSPAGSTSSTVQTETLTVKIGRIEFKI